jgi:hypothetical protein
MIRSNRLLIAGLLVCMLAGTLVLQCTDRSANNGPVDGKNVSLRVAFPAAGMAQGIDLFRLTVSGDDMRPLSFIMQFDGGFITGEAEVPAGERRLFVLTAEEMGFPICDTVIINDTAAWVCDTPTTVIFQGSTVARVIPDEVTRIDIAMRPMVPMVKLSPHAQDVVSGRDFSAELKVFNVDSLQAIQVYLDIAYLSETVVNVEAIEVVPSLTFGDDVIFNGSIGVEDRNFVNITVSKPVGVPGGTGIVDRNGDATLATIRYISYSFVDVVSAESVIEVDVVEAAGVGGANIDVTGIREDTARLEFIPVEDYIVTFADPVVENAVRDSLRLPTGDIKRSQVLLLSSLNFTDLGAMSIEGIDALENLRFLYMDYNLVTDLKLLASLTKLYELRVGGNPGINDLSPLAGLTQLTRLYVQEMDLATIAPLAGLVNLDRLAMYGNKISDLSPLKDMTNLHVLEAGNNQIVNIDVLEFIPNFTTLYLNNNQITNILPLVNNSGIGQFDTVDLTGNPLDTESLESLIPALRQRGVNVIFGQ